jgi:outer membrane lipoprotein-sorting protein
MRFIGFFLCVAAIGILPVPLRADDTSATSRPSLTADSTIDQILDALDSRGQGLSDFTATVKLTHINGATGDAASLAGTVYFQRKDDGDTRIRVNFLKKIEDDKIFDEHHEYILDAGWLIERDYKAKKEMKHQVRKPGEKLDLMKLGEGPFPLPIGQKKEDVKAQFDVKKIDPARDDPPGTVHLQLAPRPDTQLARKFRLIDVWVDTANSMSARIQTTDNGNPDAPDVKVTDLTDVKVNTGLGDKDFAQDDLPGDWMHVTDSYVDR